MGLDPNRFTFRLPFQTASDPKVGCVAPPRTPFLPFKGRLRTLYYFFRRPSLRLCEACQTQRFQDLFKE
ncbi:hypothetical protein HMPREF9123_1904 [Neisseria bacilliformis ATCC BAA-1200]|uniref:Uncharacterized protein n=1 Tax=Neisseria bacilliformis ATCC BAA-1200 TaxID=888742 RepID=F2BDU8_9NEIS|nr:hypothetical protein HMPREF9123_1904 [Neisseria bacilliformis ATCC BAA-1200]